jgi:hypothetical protein
MAAFSAEWLELREPFDLAARSARLAGRIADALDPADAVAVVDLGAGTGATVRALADFLPVRQDWLLVDHERALLDQVRRGLERWAAPRGAHLRERGGALVVGGKRLDCRIETRTADLAVLEGTDLLDGRTLVTASALLDLVSDDWLRALIGQARTRRAAMLFTLSYDGRLACDPADPFDERVRDLVNRHQRTDKGLGGPALGPAAPGRAEALLLGHGYSVDRESSDWRVPPGAVGMQHALLEGWAQAAAAMAADERDLVEAWRQRRLALVDEGRSNLVVGHQDVAAWL